LYQTQKKGIYFFENQSIGLPLQPEIKNLLFNPNYFNKNMNHYEVTFIIDPVLSGDEIKSTANTYEALLKDQGCSIVHVHEIGLKQLAYPINKKSSGIYYCIEFTSIDGTIIGKLELSLRRDERIMRFLTVRLDKYGIKYNEDRRTGKISAYRKKEAKKKPSDAQSAPVARQEVKAPAPAPVVAAPVVVNEEE
jgi:small subunit ribosomal protein S6